MDTQQFEEQPAVVEAAADVPATPKAAWFWIKDTRGNPSATITFVTVAFWVTTLAYVTSTIHQLGPVEFRQFDTAACGVYMVPLLSLYFGRRYTEAKFGTGAQ
jgi:hypothetical protein